MAGLEPPTTCSSMPELAIDAGSVHLMQDGVTSG
jgi:hypothetical protein